MATKTVKHNDLARRAIAVTDSMRSSFPYAAPETVAEHVVRCRDGLNQVLAEAGVIRELKYVDVICSIHHTPLGVEVQPEVKHDTSPLFITLATFERLGKPEKVHVRIMEMA